MYGLTSLFIEFEVKGKQVLRESFAALRCIQLTVARNCLVESTDPLLGGIEYADFSHGKFDLGNNILNLKELSCVGPIKLFTPPPTI